MSQGTLDIFGVRPAALARASHPMQSHTAAASVKKDTLTNSQRTVLELLRGSSRPLMAWEAEMELAHLALSGSRVRSAFAELERKGKVQVVGEGETPYGRPARKWRAV